MSLHGADLRRLLDFSDLAADVERVPQITEVLLPALADLTAATLVRYHYSFSLSVPASIDLGWPPELFTLTNMAAFARLSHLHPLIRSLDRVLATAPTRPFAISQLMSEREWRNSQIYQEAMKALGGEDQVAMTLWRSRTDIGAITLTRHGGRFTDRDLDVIHSVRRCLAAATRRATAAAPPGWVAMQTRPVARWVIPHEVLLSGRDPLSVRESEILTLVAEGLTSMAIGRRLSISSRTVEKHLENLHRKIGVSSSVAAIHYLSTCRNGHQSERSVTM